MAPSGGGLMLEGDTTIIVSFSAAGITIPLDDTTWIDFLIGDHPDIGLPNLKTYRWWFMPTTGIEEADLPEDFGLSVFPNPFNSAVTISVNTPSLSPPQAGEMPKAEGVYIQIFDINGQMVAELRQNRSLSGAETTLAENSLRLRSGSELREIIWCPHESVGSGVYLVRARIDNHVISKRVVLIK